MKLRSIDGRVTGGLKNNETRAQKMTDFDRAADEQMTFAYWSKVI